MTWFWFDIYLVGMIPAAIAVGFLGVDENYHILAIFLWPLTLIAGLIGALVLFGEWIRSKVK